MINLVTFCSFSTLLLAAVFFVLFSRSILVSIIGFTLTTLFMGMIWLLLKAEFLAFSLILIYAGALVILFLFAAITLNLQHTEAKFNWLSLLAGLIFVIIIATIVIISLHHRLTPYALINRGDDIKSIGNLIYTKYFLSFEVVGIILLTGLLAITKMVKT